MREVVIPATEMCTGSGSATGTAVAVVPGGKRNAPKYPVLLALSCTDTSRKLYFIDPATGLRVGDALPTTFATGTLPANQPTTGWQSLAHRPDKGDLLACGSVFGDGVLQKTVIYSIDYSPFTTTADGTATYLRDGPAGTTCDGIAWDVKDVIQEVGSAPGRVYQADGAEPAFFLETPGGGFFTTTNDVCPFGAAATGLSVAGHSLFAACPSTPSLVEVDKLKGTLNASYSSPTFNMADIECDPVTFASQNTDAVWIKDRNLAKVYAQAVTAGTCSGAQLPVVVSACDQNNDGVPDDVDGDGLWDCWEKTEFWSDSKPGIAIDGVYTPARDPIDSNGQPVRLTLCVDGVCAGPDKKDIFVEVDTMIGHSFAVGSVEAALSTPPVDPKTQVKNAFAAAPVGPGNGIRLHIQHDDQDLPWSANTAFPPCTPAATGSDADFDNLKARFFGTTAERGLAEPLKSMMLAIKAWAFRYVVFVDKMVLITGETRSRSGCAELPGNDAIIALGDFGATATAPPTHGTPYKQATADQQAGTFMHELGHLLGLRHGGGVLPNSTALGDQANINCKPNYLSVMSYSRQMAGSPIAGRRLDYSRWVGRTLSEATLDERLGIFPGTPPNATSPPPAPPNYVAGDKTVFGSTTAATGRTVSTDSGRIDWNRDLDTVPADAGVNTNINRIGNATGCDGAQVVGGAAALGTIEGYDDWANLQYNFRNSLDFGDGRHDTAAEGIEMNITQATELNRAADLQDNGICGSAECKVEIRPLDATNTINLARDPYVIVAILGNANFDVSQVETSSLTFSNAPVVSVHGIPLCAVFRLNADAFKDVVCTFPTNGLVVGQTSAMVEGHLKGTDGSVGTNIAVQDKVRVIRRSGDD